MGRSGSLPPGMAIRKRRDASFSRVPRYNVR
jgi:hypothetical protein